MRRSFFVVLVGFAACGAPATEDTSTVHSSSSAEAGGGANDQWPAGIGEFLAVEYAARD